MQTGHDNQSPWVLLLARALDHPCLAERPRQECEKGSRAQHPTKYDRRCAMQLCVSLYRIPIACCQDELYQRSLGVVLILRRLNLVVFRTDQCTLCQLRRPQRREFSTQLGVAAAWGPVRVELRLSEPPGASGLAISAVLQELGVEDVLDAL